MNRTVVILSLATTVFAASTVYLAADKYLRHTDAPAAPPLAATRPDAPRRQATLPQSTDFSDEPRHGAPAGSSSIQRPDATAAPPVAAKQDTPSEGALLFARQFLTRYDDSAQRSAMLDEAKVGIRRQYAKLKEQLKLSDTTFEQVVTLLAEETLQIQEEFSRCAVDPQCNANDPSRRNAYVDRSQEFLAVLGANDIEAFNQFRSSIGERDQVIQLRGRLPDSHFLPEAQAERLISALAEERKLFQQESDQRGASVRGWGTQLGMLFYSDDSSSADQQVAEATQFSQRMRARAAGVLSPAQLAVYVQMQDELLTQLTASLRPPARKGNSAPARSI